MFCDSLRYEARNQGVMETITAFRSSRSHRIHVQGGHRGRMRFPTASPSSRRRMNNASSGNVR